LDVEGDDAEARAADLKDEIDREAKPRRRLTGTKTDRLRFDI
jgi:hypothetical protein